MVDNMPPIPEAAKIEPAKPPVFDQAVSGPDLPQDPGPKKAISGALMSLWTMLAVQLGISLIASGIVGTIGGVIVAMDPYGDAAYYVLHNLTDLISSIVLVIAVPAAILSAILVSSKRLNVNLKSVVTNTSFSKKWLIKGPFFLYGCALPFTILYNLITMFFSLFGLNLNGMTGTEAISGGWFSIALSIFSIVILAPVFEELLFRGFICKGLARYSKPFAVVFSAILFSLAHMNLTQSLPAFGMGLALGYVCLKTDSLIPCVVMHMVNNLMAALTLIPGLDAVLSILILIISAAGIIWMFVDHHEITEFFSQGGELQTCWAITARRISLYVLIVILAIVTYFSVSA